MPEYRKKLIEVALPLEAINKESAREKSIRHGHPSTLHLWWARRPLAACRAVLWERQDSSLLIMPASVPIDDPLVQYELTRYLEDPWMPIIEGDVDGAHSLPLRLDREHPNLGRYSATRRVARTIYMGSAPTLHTANQGIEEQHIKVGCVQPGESVAIFGDALHRLTEQANHLYVQDKRYWYSTQPSVTRLAQDRAAHRDHDDVMELIVQRLRAEQGIRGSFAHVQAGRFRMSGMPGL